jgi:hypothetical protein
MLRALAIQHATMPYSHSRVGELSRLKRSCKIAADRIERSLDLSRQALHRGNRTECDDRHDQRIFNQVLRLFPDNKILYPKMKP